MGKESAMSRYRINIAARGYEAMADLVRKYKITVARHTVRKLAKDRYQIQAHATAKVVRTLRDAGYKVTRVEDADRAGKRRIAEARAAVKVRVTAAPGGVAPLDHYRTVDEVEAAVGAAAVPPHAPFTDLITLPEKT